MNQKNVIAIQIFFGFIFTLAATLVLATISPTPTRAATGVAVIDQPLTIFEPPQNPTYPGEAIAAPARGEAFQSGDPLQHQVFIPILFSQPHAPCNPSNGSGGLGVAPGDGKVLEVGGLQASVVVGPGYDESRPTYLAFFLHGDGGENWRRYAEKKNDVMTVFVNEHNWILVAPQSPNGKSWWKDFNGNHIAKFQKVLDEMFDKYNLCRNTMFGSSGSGGGVFWSGQFFPEKGGDYPAHTVLACGASGGSSSDKKKLKAIAKDPEVVKNSTFYHVYGSEDKTVPPHLIEANMAMYREAGFTVKSEKLEGAGHCNKWVEQGFPRMHDQIAAKWEEMARELKIIQ